MATVALLSDFGADNYAVGVMKSAVLATCPDARFIDITHAIPPQDIAAASYLLAMTLPYFAPGTVYLAVVDPGVGGERRALAVECGRGVIVTPDNGLAAEALERHGTGRTVAIREEMIEPLRGFPALGATFAGRDLFGPAAGHIAAGNDLSAVGEPTGAPCTLDGLPEVATAAGLIHGHGRYTDRFGNVLTNITSGHIGSVFGEPAGVVVAANGRMLGPLQDHYASRTGGEMIALINSWGVVEIGVVGGSAAAEPGFADPARVTVELSRLTQPS